MKRTIPEFTWAVFPCVGRMPDALQDVNTKIFTEWLPALKEYEFAALESGVHLICSRKREQEVRGFGCRYSIYALLLPEKCIVVYAPKYREFFSHKKWKNSKELIEDMESEFRLSKMEN